MLLLAASICLLTLTKGEGWEAGMRVWDDEMVFNFGCV